VKRLAVVLRQRRQRIDDRLPGIGLSRDDDVPTDLRVNTAFTSGIQDGIDATRFAVGREDRRVEDGDAG
jgi:hypothetical protein